MPHPRALAAIPLLFLALPGLAAAQAGVVHGRVVSGSGGEPVIAANIVVRSVADSAIVGGEATDRSGVFRIGGLAAGHYVLEVSSLGYARSEPHPFTLTSRADTVSLGTIRLTVQAVALEEVTVVTERPPVVFAPDRTIYSAEGLAVGAGGSGTQLLEGIPELEVDIDGSIELRGSTPAIYINGRPAPMDGEALSIFLQNFPADAIDRVEVISNPSARYDAEGAGGIVDIVLKEDVDLGINASVFANASSRGDVGTGTRASWQRGAFTLSGGGNVRYSGQDERSTRVRDNLLLDPPTRLEQESRSERMGLSGNLDVEAELELGESGRAWTELRAHRDGSENERWTEALEAREGELIGGYTRLSSGESARQGAELEVGYRHELGDDHELQARASAESGIDDDLSSRDTRFMEADQVELPPELMLDETDEAERELSLQIDYERPLGEASRLEAGVRADHDHTDNDRVIEEWVDSGTDPLTQARGFGFTQQTTSAYVTASRRVGPVSVQLGGRLERTGTRLELPLGDAHENSYLSFFPSGHLSWDLEGGRSLRASYSRRIRRPSPSVLNPMDRSSDPLERSIGNPDIEAQYTDSWSVGMNWTGELGTLRFSPYYRRTHGDWVRITTVDEEGISTETWENLAESRSYGASLTASARRSRTFRGSASLSTYREVREASEAAAFYSGSSFRWSLRGNGSAQIDRTLSVQGMIRYTPPQETRQGRSPARAMTHLAVRKQIMGGRGSLNVRIQDPFDLYSTTFVTRDPTNVRRGGSDRSMRELSLSMSYTFSSMDRGRSGGDERGGRRGGGRRW